MLKDKVIVISGGAGLIGKELVRAVVENRGVAIIADIDKKLDIKELGFKKKELKKIDYITVNITSKDSLQNAIKILDKKYKKIDALVNCAYPKNKNYGRDFFEVEYSDFVENVGMHLGGYFLSSKEFAKYFKNQGYGNIINIASIYGVIAPKFEIYKNTNMIMPVEYAAIKSALIHLTKYMAKYLKKTDIRVNAISPGGILDNQPKEFLKKYNSFGLSKGMLEARDLKGTLIYLLSDMSKYVNGQNIIVDDGFTI